MQDRIRFPLTSDQCELLVAFEAAGSLAQLAKMVHKDPSVVSRNLQSLGDTGVIAKLGKRWTLTPLGRQINNWTRSVAASQQKILGQASRLRLTGGRLPALTPVTALLLIGVQNGWDDVAWGARNNGGAEDILEALLDAWRTHGRPVYHIPHHSREPSSPLRPGTVGAAFKPCSVPRPGEDIVPKSVNSAFVSTPLEALLRQRGHDTVVIAGFSTNHCVDATTRSAGDLGFSAFVVADACISFERAAPDGTVVRAEDTHRVVMANLNQEFAVVVSAAALLAQVEPETAISTE